MSEGIKEFFEPKSVAIIGASPNPGKLGYDILKNMLDAGFKGKIFPINPQAPEILGIKVYSSVEEIPEPLDLAVIAIPAKLIPDVMEKLALKSIKSVIIISSGFRELGEEGYKLEQIVIKIAKKAGIRIVGPNCQGITNQHNGLLATFGGFTANKGSIAVISQSGSVSGGIQNFAQADGIGISKLVNLGNKADVNEIDILQYLKDDNKTRVIALYLEGVTDGKKFMKVAQEVAQKKPIVLLKGGKTELGMRASASHTGSLASNFNIFQAAIKQMGIIQANTLEEFYDFAKIFSFISNLNGPGVFIITSSGGAGILASDTFGMTVLKLPLPKKQAIQELKGILSPLCIFSNPFDLGVEFLNKPDSLKNVIDANFSNEEIHAFLVIFADPIPGVAEIVNNIAKKIKKPLITVYFGGFNVEIKEKLKLHMHGIPVFPSSERGIKALNALVKYSEFIRKSNAKA